MRRGLFFSMPLGILHGKLIDIRFNMSTADENGIELLSDYLLRLGGLARDVPAPDFMGRAVQLIRTAVDFQRGWWGFSAEHGPSNRPLKNPPPTPALAATI